MLTRTMDTHERPDILEILLQRTAGSLDRYRRRRRSRKNMKELAALSDRTLKDIGVTRNSIPEAAGALESTILIAGGLRR